MEEDKTKNADSESKNIEDVLRERGRIDEMIQKKFRKRMAILFSDICGFTHFTEEKGDIASRAWVQQHHDIVLPIIKSHGGRVITIMGDGVLSSFPDSLSAVQGSISIQKALARYNKEKDPDNEIHVSMGINSGEVLLDGDNVAGDVVNVASRIETKAEKDQILISKSAYNDVEGSEDLLCRAHGSVTVKGKSKPLELYRVIWQDEDIVLNIAPQVRAFTAVEPEIKAPLKTLQVDITREEDRLKISVSEQNAGEVSTVRHYEELPVSMELIGKRCNEIIKTLNNANRGGRLSKDILLKLREVGQVFRDELFTITVKNKIMDAKAEHLILNLDDQLVHVPWELLHDGKQFLCQRFNMGRLVRTRQAFLSYKSRALARPLKMLLLADPGGDLKGAYEEGKQIRDFMDRDKSIINATLRSEGIGNDFIKEKIRNFDIVHFAGHAEFNADNPGEGGWRLTDGILKAKDISKMAGTGAMPALIFSNACQSARTEEWRIKENFQDEIFGLANAFILAGVKHYMGTFWEILDEPSRLFAMEFYKNLLSGMTIGSATRQSRLELIDKYGEETIVWASYLLYGDPTFNYMDQLREMNHEEKKPERLIAPEKASLEVRAGEEKLDFGKGADEKSGKGWYWVLGCIIVMAMLLTGYFSFFSKGTSDIEQSLLSSYHTGDYLKARETGSLLMEKNPDLRLSYVILGNIHLMEGDLRTAESFYQKGISAAKGTNDQKAEALMGLGRIASIEGNSNEAMEYYRKSAELAPGMGRAYASQAMLLDRLGEYEQALDMFNRAEEASLIDPGYTVVARETGKKAALKNDREKQEQIDALVKDLLENMKEPKTLVPEDGWTSMPLTMWIMEPETIGYSLQEGKEQIIGSCVLDNLINNSRVSIVERGILDKLLEELKLGTSRLADQSTALSLGRIMAARMILTGKVHYSGEVTQITFRLIETETGQVKAAINEEFNSDMPASEIAEKLTDILAEKIHALYPLRGIVSGMNDKLIAINIGQNHGVRQGQRFRVKDTDLVLEIDKVQPETCSAKQIEGTVPINEGLLVEEEEGRSD